MGILTHLTLPSPAKINLFLHITGRRNDGYHNLQTLFHLLELSDEMTFELLPNDKEISVTCPGLDIPEKDNLAYRAALMLQRESGSDHGVLLDIQKSIPDGGGLGGGSSNAATTLHGLNRLWGCGFSVQELASLGLRLGADVPVFVAGQSSWAEGIGEQLTPVHLPSQTYLILNPGCHVATHEIFSHPDLTRDSSTRTIARFLEQGSPISWGRNDCQSVVCSLYPEVSEALDWLSQWGTAKMTGTGSCIFLPIPTEEKSKEILSQVPARWSAFVTAGVRESGLLRLLDKQVDKQVDQ
jgi:4-diphosphocytidyl-2-C-methyl-D-erythritol kinase